MPEVPAAGAARAGELQIGDRVTWLAKWNDGEPSKIIKVRELDPGYVEITEELDVVHRVTRQLEGQLNRGWR